MATPISYSRVSTPPQSPTKSVSILLSACYHLFNDCHTLSSPPSPECLGNNELGGRDGTDEAHKPVVDDEMSGWVT